MRRSEFLRAVDQEFGARGAALLSDLVLPGIGATPADALSAGVAPRRIWFELCEETEVPVSRRHGAGRIEPRRR